MRSKILLFLLFLSAILNAQEPNRSLVITECRSDSYWNNYIELTNMGDTPINLGEYKFGRLTPWGPKVYNVNDPWPSNPVNFWLPEKILQPEESYVITLAWDFTPTMYSMGVYGFSERQKQIEIYDIADLLIHVREPNSALYPEVKDSVTTYRDINPKNHNDDDAEPILWQNANGAGAAYYITHFFGVNDSAVVDQVNGIFDNDGNNFGDPYDVAGVSDATMTSLLIRKYTVKTGNVNFDESRGNAPEESEWMVIPRSHDYAISIYSADQYRDLWWTVGDHGPYVLDENTLESESDGIEVDFANKTITVPWGTRRLDDIMQHMKKKSGVAWNYDLNPNYADSLYRSAQTGDKLTVYVAGNTLQQATFNIVVTEPAADANIVVPIAHPRSEKGPVQLTTVLQQGILGWPRVTRHNDGTDTITGSFFGIPNALRTDSLQKYLEKPSNATWEYVWVDGTERADLKNGDKLKITSENGSVKEYFIQVQNYTASSVAELSAITWPDVPNYYKGVFGWKGDTIPNFSPISYNYKLEVPLGVKGIPALTFKKTQLNSKVTVKRAKSIEGTTEDRTISFTVTSEDNTTSNTYTIELIKEKDPANIQPFTLEPFLSEIYNDRNSFFEIVNPGNQILDLSNYMVAMSTNTDPVAVIKSRSNVSDWINRYTKYIPGYKWVDETHWAVTPGIVEPDVEVNPYLRGGEVFVGADISYDNDARVLDYWFFPDIVNVLFRDYDGRNYNGYQVHYRTPWEGEAIGARPIMRTTTANWYMWKILNDSIKLGLKPATDPNDFELIERFGMVDGSNWIIGGRAALVKENYMRKPDVYKGNPEAEGSFGTDADNSEWTYTNTDYWLARNAGWPGRSTNLFNDGGKHFMNEVTVAKSTVSSLVYKVSKGYSMEEEIRGVTTGTTAAEFLSNIIKGDENQTLTVKSTSNGSELVGDAALSLNDTLVVLSADSTNTSKYILEVGEGLSSDALLTSNLYKVTVQTQPESEGEVTEAGVGYVSGFEYGTTLTTVLKNISVPTGASIEVINNEGAYVPLTMLNFDTAIVIVTVNSETYLDVLAEDGITRIVYQLLPSFSENDAFILSDVYTVTQSLNLIQFIPRGTNVQTFLSNLISVTGATVKLVDKMGSERTEGSIVVDDKVVVTSANGKVTRAYHLAMLRTEFNPEPGYLAYILSQDYAIDQVNYIVSGSTGKTLVSDFNSRITAALGATFVVTDAEGNEKTTGDLDLGDKVKVTSADGKIVVMYNIDVDVTSARKLAEGNIQVYPNPTSGKVNIRGVEAGNRIHLLNSIGSVIRNIEVDSNTEVISLDGLPSGIFIISIHDKDKLIGNYKLIKK